MIRTGLQKGPRNRQTGTSLLLFTLLVTLLVLPLLGLAIDGAIVFWVRTKLSAAVDAAALAGGRSINVYETQAVNTGTAVTVAQEWFSANYPVGWLGTTLTTGSPSVTVQPTSTATQQVNVSASVVVPLIFMRMLGKNSITISAVAQSARRNLNLVLVLDRSSSLGPAPYGVNSCPQMIAAAQNFVNMFTDGFDTLGLVTFSTTANTGPIDYAPTTHFKSNNPTLSTTIGTITCVGMTSTAQALNVAYSSIKSTGLTSALNVIVLFTDGQPNEVVANNWKIKTSADTQNTRYGPLPSGANPPGTWTLANSPASSCNGGVNLSGGLTIYLDPNGQSDSNTGYTAGIFNTNSRVAINSQSLPPLVSGSNCSFNNTGTYGATSFEYVRNDVAYIPTSDIYGNSITGNYKTYTAGTLNEFPSGPYQGQLRDDEQLPGIVAAAFNAADNQATSIRNDSTYTIVIYTIGLDGAPDVGIDPVFLERVANDPRSPIYDSTKPAGYFAYAANASALNQAFYQVASQVLRLAH